MSNSAITGPVFSDVRRAPSGTAAAPSFAFNDSTGTGVYLVSPGVLGLSTAGVQRVVVDASGNVGIGTASPTAKLHVNGNLQAGNSLIGSDGQLELNRGGTGDRATLIDFHGSGSPGVLDFSARIIRDAGVNGDFILANTGSGLIRFDAVGAERMRIDGSGITQKTGVGVKYEGAGGGNFIAFKWSSPNIIARVDNVVDVTLANVSDYRLKKNIETQEQPALERIAQLRPVKYEFANYGTLFKEDGVQREGFIAHELQEVIPSAVEGEKDAEEQIQSLKLDALCSVMVKAIQEQQAQIEALKAEVAALKAP